MLSHEKKNFDMINCFRVIKNTEHPTAPVDYKMFGEVLQ